MPFTTGGLADRVLGNPERVDGLGGLEQGGTFGDGELILGYRGAPEGGAGGAELRRDGGTGRFVTDGG